MNLVVIEQIGVVLEEADFDGGAGKKPLRRIVEQQRRGALQVFALGQAQPFEQASGAHAQGRRIQPTAFPGVTAKGREGRARKLFRRDSGQGRAVPVPPLLAQQEAVQRRALQRLGGAATAVEVFAPEADRVAVGMAPCRDKLTRA